MLDGWISIHRKIQEHWIWKNNEVFDKRSAWIDLLLIVNHYNERIYFDGQLLEIERGQKITSIDQLAKRWKWSRHKVTDFLDKLEKDGMIVKISDSKRTLIGIENYEKYQFTKKDEKMRDTTSSHESTEIEGKNNVDIKKWDTSGTQKGQVLGHKKDTTWDTNKNSESTEKSSKNNVDIKKRDTSWDTKRTSLGTKIGHKQ